MTKANREAEAGNAFYDYLKPFWDSEHAERIAALHDDVLPKMKEDGESLQQEARLKKAAEARGMTLWEYIYSTALQKLRKAVEADKALSAFRQANPALPRRQAEPGTYSERSPGQRRPKSGSENAKRLRRRQGIQSFAASLREKGLPDDDNAPPSVAALMELLEPFWGSEYEAEMWEFYKQWTRLTDDDREAYQAEADRRNVPLREVIFSEALKHIIDYIRRRPHLRDIAWPPREFTTYQSYELTDKSFRLRGTQTEAESNASDAGDIIPTPVATQRYQVSAKTLSRAIQKGILTDHRRPGHSKNATMRFSDRELRNTYPLRKKGS